MRFLNLLLLFISLNSSILYASNNGNILFDSHGKINNKWNEKENSMTIGDSLNCTCIGFYMDTTARNVFVKDTLAYVIDQDKGLRIIDVSDPQNLIEIGQWDTEGFAKDIYVQDTLAYVADGSDGLRIIDVSNPQNPTEIGHCDTGDDANNIYMQDTLVYIADGEDGLRIVDISNPQVPVEVGFYNTNWDANDVYVQDTLAYVADYGDGLRIIDVSNPQNPTEIGHYDTGYDSYFVINVKDTLAYIGNWGTLRILNVAKPESTKEVGYYDTNSFISGIFLKDTLIYVTADIILGKDIKGDEDCDGLYIINYTGENGIKSKTKYKEDNIRSTSLNSCINIEYSLKLRKNVNIKIYDILGRNVAQSVNKMQNAGQYNFRWIGKTGIYFIKMQVGKEIYTKRAIIIK